jgi:hypothetical protein
MAKVVAIMSMAGRDPGVDTPEHGYTAPLAPETTLKPRYHACGGCTWRVDTTRAANAGRPSAVWR